NVAFEEGLRTEVVELLRALIQAKTINPPGQERRAVVVLERYLTSSGVAYELYERFPGRPNLVARIPGKGSGPRLMLLSHTDTVIANPIGWRVDPWQGAVEDG